MAQSSRLLRAALLAGLLAAPAAGRAGGGRRPGDRSFIRAAEPSERTLGTLVTRYGFSTNPKIRSRVELEYETTLSSGSSAREAVQRLEALVGDARRAEQVLGKGMRVVRIKPESGRGLYIERKDTYFDTDEGHVARRRSALVRARWGTELQVNHKLPFVAALAHGVHAQIERSITTRGGPAGAIPRASRAFFASGGPVPAYNPLSNLRALYGALAGRGFEELHPVVEIGKRARGYAILYQEQRDGQPPTAVKLGELSVETAVARAIGGAPRRKQASFHRLSLEGEHVSAATSLAEFVGNGRYRPHRASDLAPLLEGNPRVDNFCDLAGKLQGYLGGLVDTTAAYKSKYQLSRELLGLPDHRR
jgi:hypothetical protein